MRIAIVHYHLKRGGVTRVIESTLAALKSTGEAHQILVLAGEVPAEVSFSNQCRTVPGLQYSNAQVSTPEAPELVDALESAAHDALGDLPEVWHIHNHSLGKNSSMPAVVEQLAQSGARLLLQMHDFAEDGRPENHRLNLQDGASLYPTGRHIHYACINGRDTGYFAASGLAYATHDAAPNATAPSKLHLLPNPVEGSAAESTEAASAIREKLGCEELLLYPVRAVRRKNFGELLLWATCLESGEALATTLGPTNQNFEAIYRDWKSLAAELSLPLHFGIGEQNDWSFEAIISSASAIVSTSIAEGFGLAYLEPWLFGKPIIGRDLPQITADFKENGIQLDGLYDSLAIPENWVDQEQLDTKLRDGLEQSYRAYGIPLPTDAVERARAGISPEPGFLDFGGLDEALQAAVIRHAARSSEARDWIRRQFYAKPRPDAEQISSNATRIRETYNLPAYGERMAALYAEVAQSPVSQVASLDPDQILSHYLKPENFRLLRT